MTVTIEPTRNDVGVIDACASAWALIRNLARHAKSVYDEMALRYSIAGPEDQRRGNLRRLIENRERAGGDPPFERPRDNLFLIWVCVRRLDDEDVPDVDGARKHAPVDRQRAFEVHDNFDDDFATPERLKR